MMAILFVGLSAHLRGGLTVWRQATSQGEAMQRAQVALDRLQRDVTRAVVYDDRKEQYGSTGGLLPPPQFSADQLRLYTQTTTVAHLPPSMRVVTYGCGTSGAAPGLKRASQSLGDAKRAAAPIPEIMLPECASLSFRYAYATSEDPATPLVLEWRATWPDDPNETLRLPRLIEATLRTTSGRVMQRLMHLPTGRFGVPAAAEGAEPAGGEEET